MGQNRVKIGFITEEDEVVHDKVWRRGKQDMQDRKRQDGQDKKFILSILPLAILHILFSPSPNFVVHNAVQPHPPRGEFLKGALT
jgi:hypothetical protein